MVRNKTKVKRTLKCIRFNTTNNIGTEGYPKNMYVALGEGWALLYARTLRHLLTGSRGGRMGWEGG